MIDHFTYQNALKYNTISITFLFNNTYNKHKVNFCIKCYKCIFKNVLLNKVNQNKSTKSPTKNKIKIKKPNNIK